MIFIRSCDCGRSFWSHFGTPGCVLVPKMLCSRFPNSFYVVIIFNFRTCAVQNVLVALIVLLAATVTATALVTSYIYFES